ncbi:hypothetical protein C8J57DRAFT_656638 [Mycena rebaudengoi]|nr:hypothetical protein C8J57DRAFT_656638 [Mycena rebaudengoi]
MPLNSMVPWSLAIIFIAQGRYTFQDQPLTRAMPGCHFPATQSMTPPPLLLHFKLLVSTLVFCLRLNITQGWSCCIPNGSPPPRPLQDPHMLASFAVTESDQVPLHRRRSVGCFLTHQELPSAPPKNAAWDRSEGKSGVSGTGSCASDFLIIKLGPSRVDRGSSKHLLKHSIPKPVVDSGFTLRKSTSRQYLSRVRVQAHLKQSRNLQRCSRLRLIQWSRE